MTGNTADYTHITLTFYQFQQFFLLPNEEQEQQHNHSKMFLTYRTQCTIDITTSLICFVSNLFPFSFVHRNVYSALVFLFYTFIQQSYATELNIRIPLRFSCPKMWITFDTIPTYTQDTTHSPKSIHNILQTFISWLCRTFVCYWMNVCNGFSLHLEFGVDRRE